MEEGEVGGKDWREGTAEHRAHAGGWRSDWGLAAHMELFVITISVGKARLASVGLYLWGEGTAGEEGGGRGEAETQMRCEHRQKTG